MEGDEAIRPRTLDTAEYVRGRVEQIAELLEVVNNTASGEVTSSGPRTIFQRLPRHMRRRAMSHNIKRLPRAMRPIALRSLHKKSQNKKPSRIWKRRPSRLLKNKIREQKKSVWLTTHVWHARRFHMQSIWGYKLPVRSCQKGFRPKYRSSLNSAVVFDQSYLCCLQFALLSEDTPNGVSKLVEIMSSFCKKNVASTFANPSALSGNLEVPTMLFAPDSNDFIGPARFSWSTRKLNLWIHPTMESEFLNQIIRFRDFQIVPNKMTHGKEGTGHYPSQSSRPDKPIQVQNMRGLLCRFHLIGPNILCHLHYALGLVSDEELVSLGYPEYREVHKWWERTASNTLPGNNRDGTQISLMVEDPRLFRSQCRRPVISPASASVAYSGKPPPTSDHLFWQWQKFRQEFLPKRLSSKEFEGLASGKLSSPRRTDFKVPILLIFRNCSTTSASNRVDFLCPSAVGYDFWLSFQFAKIHPIGLHDKSSLDFESALTTFPNDCPDSMAGRKHCEEENKRLVEIYHRRPSNRRINFQQQLGEISLFHFDWSDIGKVVTEGEHVFVLRDRMLLKRIETWLQNKENAMVEDVSFDNGCLVPVSLKMLSRGIPKRFALIYCLNVDDLEQINLNPGRPILMEGSSDQLKEGNEDDSVSMKMDISEYLPLHGNSSDTYLPIESTRAAEKLVQMKDLFAPHQEDKDQRKRKRNRRKREQKQERGKPDEELPSSQLTNAHGMTPDQRFYNRKLIGRVVRGDYSFYRARGFAFGYIPLPFLKQLGRGRTVLIRNTTSKFGHPAEVAINWGQSKI